MSWTDTRWSNNANGEVMSPVQRVAHLNPSLHALELGGPRALGLSRSHLRSDWYILVRAFLSLVNHGRSISLL